MARWVRCSYVLSALAFLTFGLLLCGNAGWLPDSALAPLRATVVAISAAAGTVGLAMFVALDWRGRTRAAMAIGAMAGIAGLSALAVAVHVLFPAD
jgi:hypothetical protein